jgi:hypothetical protein
MKRVYVMGAYSADNVISVLDNMREGMRLATEVMLAGYFPFVPWFDFHFQLMLRNKERLSVNDYYQYSLAWLEVSEACILVPGWENSKGTLKEIERADQLSIPIFHSLQELRSEFPIEKV